MAGNTLAPVIDFLAAHAPFSAMPEEELRHLAQRLQLAFFAQGEVLAAPDDGAAARLYIIKQGRVAGEPAGDPAGGQDAWELGAGEAFPIGALMAGRPVTMVHRATQDTFCFELARDDFLELLQRSAHFKDFCTRRLANLLDNALRHVQTACAAQVTERQPLTTPLQTLVRRRPVRCRPQTSIRAALETMQRERVGSIVACDDDERPVGVFTLHDLLDRVALPEHDLDAPIASVMTHGPLSLPAQALAHEAALLMAREGFGHVCIVEGDRLVGVVSERDLFAFHRLGLVNLTRAILHAHDIPALKALSGDVHRAAHQLLAQGAQVDQITRIITALNDHITRRVIELCDGDQSPPFTWLAFGSEGRHEQTLRTDQDNGILLAEPLDEAGRVAVLVRARRINEALAECGFPLCPGNIMASNPELCLTAAEWRQRFDRWIEQGSPEHLLKVSIFFDLRALLGDEPAVDELRAWILERAGRTPRFLRLMAENALRNAPPLGLIRDFQVSSGGEHPNTLDLKGQGAMPFTDAARVYALAHGIRETNTARRLLALAEADHLPRSETAAWIDAYHFIQLLRLRQHHDQERAGVALDNHLDPDTLNELDRRILKESFRQARKLQARLGMDYAL
ncbi:CBS domain-containing protein [Ectothiorhodospiraceae bacterium 2226]|nr:CBS domain-containing protein [Ectothiorhodospiraceae bacterium 2226]